MPRKANKPPRLSGTIEDLPLRDYPADDQSTIKGGALGAASAQEITSPRDPASGLPTGKHT